MSKTEAIKTFLPHKLGDTHIRLIRIYKSVIESGGFAAAEVELNIGRSAISIAIAELETLLNMKLCHRGRGGFSVTEEGETVYQSSLRLLTSLETFKSEVNTINRELKGEFNIGITENLSTIPQMRNTSALAALKDRGPDIYVNLRMGPPTDIETGILDGKLHVGVVTDLRKLSGLNYIPLYKEISFLYCSNEHPLYSKKKQNFSFTELSKYDAVIPSYQQTAKIIQQQKKLKATATATDREGIAFLILTGRYIGFLPAHFAERWIREGLIRAIQPKKFNFVISYSAIIRKGARSNYILETYLEELNKTKESPIEDIF